jgi:DNA-binding response OmpR family regulator
MSGVIEILLIEDNAGDVVLIRQSLADFPVRVNLHVARDGEQALSMLAKPHLDSDLIILDLNIPKIPGLEILERLRNTKTPPIVIFSSSTDATEIRRTLELGAREYVHKPMDMSAFMDAVVGIVKKWGMSTASEATFA